MEGIYFHDLNVQEEIRLAQHDQIMISVVSCVETLFHSFHNLQHYIKTYTSVRR